MARVSRILFASDFSKASGRALAVALSLAKATGAAVCILHVIVPITPLVPEQYLNAALLDEIDAQARKTSQRHLTKLVAKAGKAGIRATSLLIEGDPADEITRVARSKRADLLVLGTHGRTGLAKFFVGSVAGRVIATASCPVVTARSAS